MPRSITSISKRDAKLMKMCKRGCVADVRQAIATGADVNARDRENISALHWAVISMSTDVVRVLIEHGARVRTVNAYHQTPLHSAVFRGSFECLRIMLGGEFETSSRILDMSNMEGIQKQENCLHLACEFGNVRIAKLLLQSGADVDFQNVNNETPLHLAVKQNMKKCVQFLVETPSPVKLRKINRMADMLSEIPSIRFFPTSINLLLAQMVIDSKADITLRDDKGRTPLDIARMRAMEREEWDVYNILKPLYYRLSRLRQRRVNLSKSKSESSSNNRVWYLE